MVLWNSSGANIFPIIASDLDPNRQNPHSLMWQLSAADPENAYQAGQPHPPGHDV